MELKKRIGQLFVVGYQGLEPSSEFLHFVEEWGIGGIIFFARNIDDPERLPKVIETFEKASGGPIFTAIDQEGGLVMRILKGGSLFPGAMALSATGDVTLTEEIFAAIGREMRSLGLNWNLAPVLDINHPSNPGIGARSFGDTPEKVAEFGAAAVKGLRSGGVLACAKHFPGKGHAMVDSHLSLPTIPYDKERLRSFELVPFRRAIEVGVDAIMTAHVFFPAFETQPNLPGTLSRRVMTDLLRNELGFKGLLITDDLEMGAITETYGVPEAARLAFLAGADLLLICHQLDREVEAVKLLLKSVQEDSAAGARLEESLERIKAAKKKIGGKSSSNLTELAKLHAPLVEKAYHRSILFDRIKDGVLPLSVNSDLIIAFPEISALVQVEESHQGEGLQNLLKQFFPKARCVKFHPKADANEITQKILEVKKDVSHQANLLALTYNAHLFTGQQQAFQELSSVFPNMILAAVRNPYDIAAIPGAKTAVACFGFRSPAIIALLETLMGKIKPRTGPWHIKLENNPQPS